MRIDSTAHIGLPKKEGLTLCVAETVNDGRIINRVLTDPSSRDEVCCNLSPLLFFELINAR